MTGRRRRNGVSGLMRVKNEAKFLELAVESCIDALDELIIVYQKCEDLTPNIIQRLQSKYPTKIKSFFYGHEILSHNLSEEEYNMVKSLPLDSVHLLSTYYNYTLSKASYRFALKIDADQIYNGEKLKEFCDAYRATEKVHISLSENLAGKFIYGLSFLNGMINRYISKYWLLPRFLIAPVKKYNSYVIKKITNDKNPVSFIGINLDYEDHQWILPLGSYASDNFPPFNGVYDHMLFEISAQTYYLPAPLITDHNKYNRCVIERFAYDATLRTRFGWNPKLLQGGFLWYHVAPLKNKQQSTKAYIPLSSQGSFKMLKACLSKPLFRESIFWYRIFWLEKRTQTKVNEVWKNNLTKIQKILSWDEEINQKN